MTDLNVSKEGGPCPVCNVQATKRCSRCGSVHYCSKEHQTEHWSMHKRYCKNMQSPNEAHPTPRVGLTQAQKNSRIPTEVGSKFTVDAIFFPCDEDHPRIIQLPFEVKEDDDEGFKQVYHMYDPPFVEKMLGDTWFGRSTIGKVEANGAPIPGGCTLELMYRDDFLQDGSTLNRSIQYITGGDTPHRWCGSMLAIRHPRSYGMSMMSDFVVNIEDDDLQILRNYFMGYGRK
ncbi:hypothetical protein SCHPADRAFT_592111 [Schizopora paradoxa]|uniref:MYND-type domain-containing protein n=1 Tax=Schizopora paradoxa TaxID=27342 RepID=A0A0H2RVL8_9AGAM|nr:hypothetical protein SCHPADRAFT_592111 [Schizopora paradoxa]